ncbi:cytosolic factor, phosphatidylinositol/phosphatidylcholine transfer protein [Kappamyces sp. JEL0680]|nr:cytosolic factor, phosphatidylinositol/phosphatidylcholine transfer protein [Kappamyces sp. JEL0680]
MSLEDWKVALVASSLFIFGVLLGFFTTRWLGRKSSPQDQEQPETLPSSAVVGPTPGVARSPSLHIKHKRATDAETQSIESVQSFHTALVELSPSVIVVSPSTPTASLHFDISDTTMDGGRDQDSIDADQMPTQVELFRAHLSQAGLLTPRHSAMILTRFLAARQGDFAKALLMVRQCEEWRAAMKVDDLVASYAYPEVAKVDALLPRYYHKEDKLGRPLQIIELDKADGNLLFSDACTTQERFVKYYARRLEENEWRMKVAYEARPTSNNQLCVIINLKGAYLSQFRQFAPLLKSILDMLLNYYPDALGALRIINAPYLFTAIWSVISLWLDARTLAKVQILGSNYHSGLLDLVDSDNLPAKYGGTCSCPGGCETSDIGVWHNGSPECEFWESLKARDRHGA